MTLGDLITDEELTRILRETDPKLYDAICAALRAGIPGAVILAGVHRATAAVRRESGDPCAGRLLEWMAEGAIRVLAR